MTKPVPSMGSPSEASPSLCPSEMTSAPIKAESLGLRSDIGSFAGSPNESNYATNAEGTAVRSHLHSTRRGSPGASLLLQRD